MPKKKTNHEFQENLKHLRDHGKDVYSDDVYINDSTKIWFYCSKNHKWQATPNNILHGTQCPYCAGDVPIIGETDLWTTNPAIAALLKNKDDGYKYSSGSNRRVEFVCKYCGTTYLKCIYDVCKRGMTCSLCSDGISYPEKFSRSMLKFLPVSNVKYCWNPSWLKPYAYDNYFEYDNQSYVLEMDGGIGHGNRQFKSALQDIDGLARDRIKDGLANERGIVVIRIDCNYNGCDRFEYIKNNIINSKLSSMFDMSMVDWRLCDLNAQGTLMYEAVVLWNDGLSISLIGRKMGYHSITVSRWLKRAANLGLCDYNHAASVSRSRNFDTSRNVRVCQYSLNGEYVATHESMSAAARSVNGYNSAICRACKRPNLVAYGYRWEIADSHNASNMTQIV